MPPPRRFGCSRHCYVWWFRDGVIFIGCGHCPTLYKKIANPVGEPALLERQAKGSRDGHQLICGRPIR